MIFSLYFQNKTCKEAILGDSFHFFSCISHISFEVVYQASKMIESIHYTGSFFKSCGRFHEYKTHCMTFAEKSKHKILRSQILPTDRSVDP